jgi:hypothetical protein
MGRILAPWEANALFRAPVVSKVTPGQNTVTPAVVANPGRVALLFSAPGTGSPITVSPDSSTISTVGWVLTSTVPTLILLHDEVGPLVAVDWFVYTAQINASLWVCEVIIDKWPEPKGDHDGIGRSGGDRGVRRDNRGWRNPDAGVFGPSAPPNPFRPRDGELFPRL